MTRSRVLAAAAAAAAMALLGGCEPGAKMWKAAADAVARGYQKGDLVVVTPGWQKKRLHHFEERGIEAAAADEVGGVNARLRTRLWVVYEGGEPKGVAAIKRGFGQATKFQVPFLTIELFDKRSATDDVAWDFLEHLWDARASMVLAPGVTASGERACGPWVSGADKPGPRCAWGTEAWEYVGQAAEKFGGEVQSCIWAHPEERGTVVLSFPDVPLGGAVLEGHHGVADTGVGNSMGGDVTLDVSVGGQPRGSFVLRKGVTGWASWKLAPDALAGVTGKVPVEFRVSTRAQHGRHYCFDAIVRKAGGAGQSDAQKQAPRDALKARGDIPGDDSEEGEGPDDDSFGSGN